MIASLAGTVKHVSLNSAVIEVGGVGILVSLPARFAAALTVGTSIDIYTTLIVREDSLTLFGFETPSSRDFFELLQTVSGIGPKVAQSALSIYEPEELASIINSGESAALERIPGLGKKGAARTLLELKEKVSGLALTTSSTNGGQWRVQLQSALGSLGYTTRDSDQIIEGLAKDLGSKASSTNIAELLKLALQSQGRK